MQTRCIWCLREQYAPGVYEISIGVRRCACGNASVGMSVEQWGSILRVRRKGTKPGEPHFTCTTCTPTPVFDLRGLLAHLRGTHLPFIQTDDPEDDEW